MPKYVMLLLSFLATDAYAIGWKPPERLLNAVRRVESSDGLYTYGDEGRSLGDFQLSEAAWLDVTSWRRSHGLKAYAYSRHVYNQRVNRSYAADYITLLHDELERIYKRPPSAGEIYAAYNMGLASFASCRYKLQRVNPVTARKCQAIHAYMQGSPELRVASVQ